MTLNLVTRDSEIARLEELLRATDRDVLLAIAKRDALAHELARLRAR